MKLLGVLIVIASCKGGAKREEPASAPAARSVVTPIAATIDAAPDASATDRLHLPKGDGIDATTLIWRSLAEVAKALGPGTKRQDGKWRHELPTGDFIVVVYEHDRVVGIEIPNAKSFDDLTDAEYDEIRIWFHVNAKGASMIRGHGTVFGQDFAHVGLAIYEKEYIERLDKRVEEETAKRIEAEARDTAAEALEAAEAKSANLLRGRAHLQRLSAEMARSGTDARFEVGDTEDEVWYVHGPCTQALLDDLASRMKPSFSTFGFRRMRCESYSASLE